MVKCISFKYWKTSTNVSIVFEDFINLFRTSNIQLWLNKNKHIFIYLTRILSCRLSCFWHSTQRSYSLCFCLQSIFMQTPTTDFHLVFIYNPINTLSVCNRSEKSLFARTVFIEYCFSLRWHVIYLLQRASIKQVEKSFRNTIIMCRYEV